MNRTRRTARVSTVPVVDDKQIAENYIHEIMMLKAELKGLRVEYKVAVMQNQPQIVLDRKIKEYDNLWITRWPHFLGPDFKQRVLPHYSPTDRYRPKHIEPRLRSNPYFNIEPNFRANPLYGPTDQPFPHTSIIEKYINWRKRGQILKAALIVRRGVKNERQRFQEWETRINGMMSVASFEDTLKILLDRNPLPYSSQEIPPSYREQSPQPYAITPPGSPATVAAGVLPPYYGSVRAGGQRRRKTRGKKQRRTRKKYFLSRTSTKKYRKN
jgi:hypothetical protein